MLYPGDPIFFPQPSTDDRKDFELNVSRDDLIVFKLPALTVVSIAKKDLKDALDKIIEDIDLNFKQTLMSQDDGTQAEQKINILKSLNNRFGLIKKAGIEKNLQLLKWLTELILKMSPSDIKNNRIKNLFKNLQKDSRSMFYSVGNLSRSILNKAKKSTYDKDKPFSNLYNQLEDKNFYQNNNLPLVTPFVNKRSNIDHSTLYRIRKPLEL